MAKSGTPIYDAMIQQRQAQRDKDLAPKPAPKKANPPMPKKLAGKKPRFKRNGGK